TEDLRDIYEDKWTVSEKIEHVMRMTGQRASLKFSELFEHATSRSEVVCTFLALLELMRLKQIVCSQSEAFGEIEVSRATAAAPSPAVAPEPVPVGATDSHSAIADPQSAIPNPPQS